MKLISKNILFSALGLIAATLPLLIPFPKPIMTLMNLVVIYAIIALGFNILLGYAGQISLGHAVFMGLGAYVSIYVTEQLQWPFLAGLLIAGILPMVVGTLLGLIALRLEGHYLAIATLGFGVAVQQVFSEWVSFTGGFDGVSASPPSFFGFEVTERPHYFFMAMVVLIGLSLMASNMLKTKTGRALLAMRDSEHAAQAMGVSLLKYKLIAFALSAFYAGTAGSLYAHLIRYVEPSAWGMELSLNLFAMVVVGGLASIGGSIAGAVFIVLVPEVVKSIPLLENFKNFSSLITGLAMILVILFMPQGIAKLPLQIKRTYLKYSLRKKHHQDTQENAVGGSSL